MRATLALLALLALAGCVPSGTVKRSGEPVPAPFLFDAHCAIDPGPECPPK